MFTQITDSVYGRRVFLFVGARDDFVQHLTEKWGKKAARGIRKDAIGQLQYFDHPSEHYVGVQSRVYYFWLICFHNTPRDIGTLCHEAFHVATTILEDLGVDTTDAQGSEALAYYLNSFVEQSLVFLFEEERRSREA